MKQLAEAESGGNCYDFPRKIRRNILLGPSANGMDFHDLQGFQWRLATGTPSASRMIHGSLKEESVASL
ncbi:unnamed protein product, partial [Citrullus colocynthis]